MRGSAWLLLGLVGLACCRSNKDAPAGPTPTPGWTISSVAVREGLPIDRKYTCDGEDISPPLSWPAAPVGTRSLALIVDDPDAPSGTFTHWLLWGMDARRTSLAEGISKLPEVRGVGRQGKTGFGKVGYGGPCPPPGPPHHYRFKLYGLSSPIEVPAGAERDELEKAMAGKVVAYSILTGIYQRAQ